jgi:hypothetical protein
MMNHPTIIELSGHIIDSLTLAKVIDRIQAVGVDYQVNDIRIGRHKQDVSVAHISIWSQFPDVVSSLLDDLKTYGASPIAENPVQLALSPADGLLPEHACIRWVPPTEILLNQTWLPVRAQGLELTIVVDPAQNVARFKHVRDVQQGEQVVLGEAGIKILPQLEPVCHVPAR